MIKLEKREKSGKPFPKLMKHNRCSFYAYFGDPNKEPEILFHLLHDGKMHVFVTDYKCLDVEHLGKVRNYHDTKDQITIN